MIIIGNTDYCFMTTGKIATSSLLEIPNFSECGKYGSNISSRGISGDSKYRVYHEIYHEQFINAKKICVIREPLDRFLSGVLQVISFEQSINLHMIKDIVGSEVFGDTVLRKLLDHDFWSDVTNRFLADCFISSGQAQFGPLIGTNMSSDEEYHFGNWLLFPHFCMSVSPTTDIVDLSNLSEYGASIGLQINKINDSNNSSLKLGITKMKGIKQVFKEVVMNLPVWHNKIKYYLEPEMVLYNELMMIENNDPIHLLNEFNYRPR